MTMMELVPKGKKIRLGDVKPGTLFECDGTIALKSEYGEVGSIIVGSGEFFCGDPDKKTDDHIVQRLKIRKTSGYTKIIPRKD
jgi:hypothetical protein